MESVFIGSGLTSAVVEVFLNKFTNFAQRGIGLILGVDENLQNLERTIAKIQALVDDLETNQLPNNASRLWLQDLKNILNDAEYFLDEIALELERRNYGDDATLISSKQVRHMVLLSFEFSIPSKIEEMQRKLNDLVGEMQSYFMTDILKLRQPRDFNIQHSTSLIDESCIVGRDWDKNQIVTMLCSEFTEEKAPSVISIVDLNRIQIELQDVLKSKSCCIGEQNFGDYSQCKSFNSFGSRFTYHMQPLSEEDCWELTKNIVLKSNSLQLHQDLEMIDSKIAKKCEGLPLAAKMIGNVLCFKSGEMQLDDLLQVELWDMARNINEIYPSLKLSYDHLPACMKRCFVYCSIFPYNFEFNKDDLIQLWVAEGFIQAQGMRIVEDVGRDYFDELLWRCFFQPSSSNTPTYKMPVLLHDLAQLVSRDSCLRVEDKKSCLMPKYSSVRHSSLLCQNIQPSVLKMFHRYKNLCTFMSTSPIKEVPYEFFLNLQRLRVLNLSFTRIYELPNSVEKLKFLRYLNVSSTHIKKLPESVANLYGLEVLKLNNCFQLLQLPKHLKNLNKLRHLELDVKRQISCMPLGLGKLTNLQMLQAFIVGKDEGRSIEELKDMQRLCGSFSITNLENVANFGEAKAALLDNKKYLNKLELQWDNHENVDARRNEESQNCISLPAFGQLPVLKSLYIDGMRGLECIDSHFCGLCDLSFPCLESLTFQDMPNLRMWSEINYNVMPRLRQLTIIDCPELHTLPTLRYLTSLNVLEVNRCPMLQSLPDEGLPTSLQNLIIMECDLLNVRCHVEEGEDWNKIKFIHNVEIDGEKVQTEDTQHLQF
ncbi:hypothetical protein FNV43_RR02421 [Rhamnella rubrinervis]|uniref:Uncharacterized protein n=1 Tax=Rhamnella rubrinervis TaxID=2594499 RepID=A0A8K0MT78_9ROSA|nr:hypothetical protein FNV43_RR02421 [Rhamnella rubrinervis]